VYYVERVIKAKAKNMQFANYVQATQYIKNQVKDQGQKYYCTDEYKKLFSVMKRMAQEEKNKTQNQESRQLLELAAQSMREVSVTWGDKVEWHNVGAFMTVTIVSGVIVNRKGIPFVQLDSPMNGKKSCKWHKGFMKTS
jgi:hypothetical protein